jgi:RNA polymerase sigma factor (sigma-70 family)
LGALDRAGLSEGQEDGASMHSSLALGSRPPGLRIVAVASVRECSPNAPTKQIPDPVHQRGVIGRRGASVDELEALYSKRFVVFERVAASVTGDSERARDAVQEAFATALHKRRSFRGEGPLEAWVWRIVLNAARLEVRRGIPAVECDEPVVTNGRPERDAELRVALACLPERQRTAVFLRYYADLDYVAIGEALGISTGTVSATLNAAHAALRSRLEEVRT